MSALSKSSLIHEALAGTPLCAAFADIESMARLGLLGSVSKDDLLEELEYRQEHQSDDLENEIELVKRMSDSDLYALKDEAISAIVDDLHQSPISYLIDQIAR